MPTTSEIRAAISKAISSDVDYIWDEQTTDCTEQKAPEYIGSIGASGTLHEQLLEHHLDFSSADDTLPGNAVFVSKQNSILPNMHACEKVCAHLDPESKQEAMLMSASIIEKLLLEMAQARKFNIVHGTDCNNPPIYYENLFRTLTGASYTTHLMVMFADLETRRFALAKTHSANIVEHMLNDHSMLKHLAMTCFKPELTQTLVFWCQLDQISVKHDTVFLGKYASEHFDMNYQFAALEKFALFQQYIQDELNAFVERGGATNEELNIITLTKHNIMRYKQTWQEQYESLCALRGFYSTTSLPASQAGNAAFFTKEALAKLDDAIYSDLQTVWSILSKHCKKQEKPQYIGSLGAHGTEHGRLLEQQCDFQRYSYAPNAVFVSKAGSILPYLHNCKMHFKNADMRTKHTSLREITTYIESQILTQAKKSNFNIVHETDSDSSAQYYQALLNPLKQDSYQITLLLVATDKDTRRYIIDQEEQYSGRTTDEMLDCSNIIERMQDTCFILPHRTKVFWLELNLEPDARRFKHFAQYNPTINASVRLNIEQFATDDSSRKTLVSFKRHIEDELSEALEKYTDLTAVEKLQLELRNDRISSWISSWGHQDISHFAPNSIATPHYATSTSQEASPNMLAQYTTHSSIVNWDSFVAELTKDSNGPYVRQPTCLPKC